MTYPPQSPEPNPYGAAPGQPGPGSQPGASSDFATEWGVKENPNRPKKVNQLTQALWAYAAASVLIALLTIVAVAAVPWFGGFIIGPVIVGLIFHGLSVVIVWFIAKEKLGVFNAADPRNPLYILLGVLGFFAVTGFFGGWSLGWYAALTALLSLARLAAVGAAFFLVTQPEVEHWLKSRPGNQRKTPPPQAGYQQQPPPPGYPQQQPPGQPPQPPVQ